MEDKLNRAQINCVETGRLSPPVSGPQNGQNRIKSGAISPLFVGNGSCRCILPCHWPVVVYWSVSSNLIGQALGVGIQN